MHEYDNISLYESFGIRTNSSDPQFWGPLWNSDTGKVNTDPQGGHNWCCGFNLRFYPASNRYYDPTRCLPINLVIIVDGIDIHENRTEADLWNDFGAEGQRILDKGYDLLVLNYTHGRDYIQRNAYALVDVLENHLPAYMRGDHLQDKHTIIAASMGTQVTRYAVIKAEQKGTDHHVGLAMYLDGPFLGANIPWSLQGVLDFLAGGPQPSAGAQDAMAGLTSPAANTLLRAGLQYGPNAAYYQYYNEMSSSPSNTLPRRVRNVAVACGSGQGLSPEGGLVGTGTWDITCASVATGHHTLPGHTWGQATISAYAESSVPVLLDAELQGGAHLLLNDSAALQDYHRVWTLDAGARPVDLSPGGWTDLGQQVRDSWNKDPDVIANGMNTMTADIGISDFIETFSSLYVRSAESGTESFSMRQSEYDLKPPSKKNLLPISYSITVPRTGTRTAANFWYGPEAGGSAIDPQMPSLSPFEAIWYQFTNISHVLSWDAKGVGELLPVGYEAFLFEQLDQFTSEEPYTSESVASSQPKVPFHDTILLGDLLNIGTNQLLTANTFSRHAMVQSFNAGNWQTLWSDAGNPGWIGSWPLNKGDKFFLARLTGGGKLLVSFSALTPGSAMVQQFQLNGGVGSWVQLWSNNGNGQFGSLPFPVRLTDAYSFGNILDNGSEQLLVSYPYVCNDIRERRNPGISGLSRASAMSFGPNGQGGYTWTEFWNNATAINTIGAHYIRFGDFQQLGQLNSGPASLLSFSALQTVFSQGRAHLQTFFQPNWNLVWSDNGQFFQQCNCSSYSYGPATFGCWTVGPSDSFHFANLDGNGNGFDQLICTSPQKWHAYTWNGGSWCLMPYFADAGAGNPNLGTYNLRAGDRWYFGNLEGNSSGAQDVIVVNPVHSCPGCILTLPSDRDAVIQRWTPSGWQLIWSSDPHEYLGNWKLYQDLP